MDFSDGRALSAATDFHPEVTGVNHLKHVDVDNASLDPQNHDIGVRPLTQSRGLSRSPPRHATLLHDDPISHFAPGLLNPEHVSRLRDAYAASEPYRYAYVRQLVKDDLLEVVKNECLRELVFTEKETDIYKVNQTGDLASLDFLGAPELARLPALLTLRNALYSDAFRSFVRDVTRCGPLSGSKQDMSVNSYRKGCHLLNHDDAIGTRRISYILYMPLPRGMPWLPEWGGALELYPVQAIGGGSTTVSPDILSDPEAPPLEPVVMPSKSILPLWGQFIFFEVKPGFSFHSVEEVTVGPCKRRNKVSTRENSPDSPGTALDAMERTFSGSSEDGMSMSDEATLVESRGPFGRMHIAVDDPRQRLSISGWFHSPREGEDGYEEEMQNQAREKARLESSRDQLAAAHSPFSFKSYDDVSVPPAHLSPQKDDDGPRANIPILLSTPPSSNTISAPVEAPASQQHPPATSSPETSCLSAPPSATFRYPVTSLTSAERAFLERFLNPSYLSARTLRELAQRFADESSLELHAFLREDVARMLESTLREQDVADGLDREARKVDDVLCMYDSEAGVGVENADSEDKTHFLGIPPHDAGVRPGSSWRVHGPPHKWRYCVLQDAIAVDAEEAESATALFKVDEDDAQKTPRKTAFRVGGRRVNAAKSRPPQHVSSSSSLAQMSANVNAAAIMQILQDELFASPAFRAWLSLISRLLPLRYAVQARRFRPGLDYTLATSEANEARLDVVLGLTPDHVDTRITTKAQSRAESGNTSQSRRLETVEQCESGWESGTWGGWECYMAPTEGDDDPAVIHVPPPDSDMSSLVSERTTDDVQDSGSAVASDDLDPDIEMTQSDGSARDDSEAGGFMSGGDDDFEDGSTLLSVQPSFNRLLLVLRDEGVMRFVKYVSAAAPGSRWDVCGEFEVGMLEEDDE